MNSKIVRKRRTDRNQVLYFIQDTVTLEYYIGLTALSYKGNVFLTLRRRMQKHMQRALTENKDWGLSRALRERGACLLYTSPSPRDRTRSRMPSSA